MQSSFDMPRLSKLIVHFTMLGLDVEASSPHRRHGFCKTAFRQSPGSIRFNEEKRHGNARTIISWAVFGLVIGLIARLLYPGRQPMGFIATMILGIVGSLLGGFVAYLFGFRPEEAAFQGGGWIMSIVGAIDRRLGSACLLARGAARSGMRRL